MFQYGYICLYEVELAGFGVGPRKWWWSFVGVLMCNYWLAMDNE